MFTGKIDQARPSKSGKTLGVKIGAKWLSTDLWELQNMIGEVITVTDTRDVPMGDGGVITYLNAYTTGAAPAAAPPGHGVIAPPAASAQNELLLSFVGRCMSGYNYSTADDVQVKNRCRMLYNLGQDILSGEIAHVETGRRVQAPASQTGQLPQDLPPVEDYDDDIPFN